MAAVGIRFVAAVNEDAADPTVEFRIALEFPQRIRGHGESRLGLDGQPGGALVDDEVDLPPVRLAPEVQRRALLVVDMEFGQFGEDEVLENRAGLESTPPAR